MARKYLDPCKLCEEKVCLGSEGCPFVDIPVEVSTKKSKPKKKEIPPQVFPLLRKLRIYPPETGRAQIKIYRSEEDLKSTFVVISVEGEVKSVSWTQVPVKRNITLKFKDNTLIKISFPERKE